MTRDNKNTKRKWFFSLLVGNHQGESPAPTDRNQVWLLMMSLPNLALVIQTVSSKNGLSVSPVQDLAEKAPIPKLDSYIH